MYSKQQKTAKPASDIPASNQFAPRSFAVPPQAKEAAPQNDQKPEQDQPESAKQDNNGFPDAAIFTRHLTPPATPKVQMKLRQNVVQQINTLESATVQRVGTEADKKPAPPAADELILSSDTAYAKNAYLDWFRNQVKAKIESWGLGFKGDTIQLKKVEIKGASTDAIVLKWDGAWGTQPATANIPFTMSPIDAKSAVTGVHKLKGWSKVASADQNILDNLFGGEVNQLSQASRDNLRGSFAGLNARSEDDQAKVLTGVIGDKAAKPYLANEPMATAAVKFKLEGPTAQKDYDFRGKKADAEFWLAKFDDATQIKIIAPKAPEVGFHYHSVQEAADAASYLPKESRAVINTILLNVVENPEDAHWAVQYNTPNFHSYMTAGAAGEVTIYPNKVVKPLPDAQGMRSSMVHETGHTWSYKKWGNDTTKGKWVDWKTAMDKDKTSVSGYAMADIAEDVAETVKVYGSTKGSPPFDEYRRIIPNRFTILDQEYK